MSFDEALAERIRDIVRSDRHTTEKKRVELCHRFIKSLPPNKPKCFHMSASSRVGKGTPLTF